jgi:hypothetical protein
LLSDIAISASEIFGSKSPGSVRITGKASSRRDCFRNNQYRGRNSVYAPQWFERSTIDPARRA